MQALEALLNRPGALEGEGREQALQLWQSLRQILMGGALGSPSCRPSYKHQGCNRQRRRPHSGPTMTGWRLCLGLTMIGSFRQITLPQHKKKVRSGCGVELKSCRRSTIELPRQVAQFGVDPKAYACCSKYHNSSFLRSSEEGALLEATLHQLLMEAWTLSPLE
jgi:hypothetical protein